MEMKRYATFVESTMPSIMQLASEWFHPSKQAEDGHYYACKYCDMECGGHERHDPDCFAQLAKNTLEKVQSIDANPEFDTHQYGKNAGQPREDSSELRNWFKARAILDDFYAMILTDLIPLNYKDPENAHDLCVCDMFGDNPGAHKDDCVIIALVKALSTFQLEGVL